MNIFENSEIGKKMAVIFMEGYSHIDSPVQCKIERDEYKNLYLNHKISDKEINNAIKILFSFSIQNDAKTIVYDLNTFNKKLSPAKEMTIEEIENELGHKIKIVKDHKGDKYVKDRKKNI